MLRPWIVITVNFAPNATYPDRSGSATFRFVEELEVKSSWRTLGDTCSFKLPRGSANGASTLYAVDQNGRHFDYTRGIASVPTDDAGNVIAGAWPLLMRGDAVTVTSGYRYFVSDISHSNQGAPNQELGSPVNSTNIIFQGYVTRVVNKIPIEVECMDDMWRFQQYYVPNRTYPSSLPIEAIVSDMLAGYNDYIDTLVTTYPSSVPPNAPLTGPQQENPVFRKVYFKGSPTCNATRTTANQNFQTRNETLAQVLARLRREVYFDFWLRKSNGTSVPAKWDGTSKVPTNSPLTGAFNALHCGAIAYWPGDDSPYTESSPQTFQFQHNIVSDSMQYTRSDDVSVGCVAYLFYPSSVTGVTNKSNGKPATKNIRYEVKVFYQNGQYGPNPDSAKVVAKGTTPKTVADEFQGEFNTYFFPTPNATNALYGLYTQDPVQYLIKQAEAKLARVAYTGWRGTFDTFGLPAVKHGDQVTLVDSVLPERNGTYLVRSVTTTFGLGGYRQRVELDIRLDGPSGYIAMTGNGTAAPSASVAAATGQAQVFTYPCGI